MSVIVLTYRCDGRRIGWVITGGCPSAPNHFPSRLSRGSRKRKTTPFEVSEFGIVLSDFGTLHRVFNNLVGLFLTKNHQSH
jgi:hypothetical protein